MTLVGLALAVALEVLAIAGMVLLAARTYEPAILRIGAPIELRRLFAPRPHPHRVSAVTGQQAPTAGQSRLSPTADLALRLIVVALVIAGALIGFGKPTAIAPVAVGLLLLIIEQTLKHLPRRPAH